MKYIKTFESIRKPKLNDYVLCEDSDTDNVSEWNEYIRTHVGKIIEIYEKTEKRSTIYLVKYKDVPNYIKPHFHFMMNGGNVIYHDRRGFFLDEIKFCSPTKRKVELMMVANKFNI